MTKRFAAALLVLAIAAPLHAAGFKDVARAIDAKRGVSRVWIPFLGLARFAVMMVQPEGVRDFQIAVFQGADKVDPAELQKIMHDKIGPQYTPLVKAWSRKGGNREWSFIYARPHGNNRFELVILAHDDEDTALVRVDVNADVLARELNEPGGMVHIARR